MNDFVCITRGVYVGYDVPVDRYGVSSIISDATADAAWVYKKLESQRRILERQGVTWHRLEHGEAVLNIVQRFFERKTVTLDWRVFTGVVHWLHAEMNTGSSVEVNRPVSGNRDPQCLTRISVRWAKSRPLAPVWAGEFDRQSEVFEVPICRVCNGALHLERGTQLQAIALDVYNEVSLRRRNGELLAQQRTSESGKQNNDFNEISGFERSVRHPVFSCVQYLQVHWRKLRLQRPGISYCVRFAPRLRYHRVKLWDCDGWPQFHRKFF